MGDVVSILRALTLAHIESINDRTGCGAKCPHADLIAEADDATVDGLIEWRKDTYGARGRWITVAGREALSSFRKEVIEK